MAQYSTDANSAVRAGSVGVGLSNVGSYQSSGTPYITSSLLSADQNSGSLARYEFPRVAKSITVKVIPTAHAGGTSAERSDPVYIFFGQPIDGAGSTTSGRNSFISVGADKGDMAPLQIVQYHYLTLRMVTGRGATAVSGGLGLKQTTGDEFTFNVFPYSFLVVVSSAIISRAAATIGS